MAIEMDHLGRCVDARIGAPGCGAPAWGLTALQRCGQGTSWWRWIKGRDGLIQRLLHADLAGLALPATKMPPVVLQTEGNALADQSSVRTADQTSSMMAISALSPRRGTVRMMRV